jgi:3-oxoacyl-[acyl-carrier protein] reductase
MITSRAGLQGGVGLGSYAAAKAGLIALAKSLAQELGKKQVLVNAVNPGFMISGMTENLADEIKERNKNESPLAVFSDPEEVADFLAHLSSDAMKQVTGQIFHFESRNTRAF